MVKSNAKIQKNSLTKEQKIYRFLLAMASFNYEKLAAKRCSKTIVHKNEKEIILSLLVESKVSLGSAFLSCILDTPTAHVTNILMILKSEFKVAELPNGKWIALSYGQQERMRILHEITPIFNIDDRLVKKIAGSNSIFSLSIHELKSLNFKLKQLV